jgi:thiamine-monophosphate kinase
VSEEFRRIAQIREILGRESADVQIGIGDDAAVLAPSTAAQVLSVDAQVDRVHFRRDLMSPFEIGRRAFTAAASDLAAMGARPRAALLSLVLPPDVDDDALLSLVRGVAEAAEIVKMPVVGGNLAAGTELSITTTVVGEARNGVLARDGAEPEQGVYVTGVLGASALGLSCLLAGRRDDPRAAPFVARFLTPVAQITVGQRLVGYASAAVDVSDGLLADLGHLCEASGVGAVVRASDVPILPTHDALAKELGLDPRKLALTGGEDFELLFTAPLSLVASEVATRIGEITTGHEVIVTDDDGAPIPIDYPRGYRHFA